VIGVGTNGDRDPQELSVEKSLAALDSKTKGYCDLREEGAVPRKRVSKRKTREAQRQCSDIT